METKDDLGARMQALEERVHIVEERLSAHDSGIRNLIDVQAEKHRLLAMLQAQVSRLSDIATAQGATLERVVRNTQRTVDLLERSAKADRREVPW